MSDGDKTILSVAAGKVIRASWNDSWGYYAVVTMSDGRSLVYAHMTKNSLKVVVGDTVTAGQAIGTMGNTGNSTGPHLHIELQKQYYKAGRTDDIAAFLGIENTVGEVKTLAKTAEKSKPSSWAKDAAEWATENGIIKGDADSDCKWQDSLTREAFAVMLKQRYHDKFSSQG